MRTRKPVILLVTGALGVVVCRRVLSRMERSALAGGSR